MGWLNNIKKKIFKTDLRTLCEREYGPGFAKMYDDLCMGCPIGDYDGTVHFLNMLEIVKHKYKGEWK